MIQWITCWLLGHKAGPPLYVKQLGRDRIWHSHTCARCNRIYSITDRVKL